MNSTRLIITCLTLVGLFLPQMSDAGSKVVYGNGIFMVAVEGSDVLISSDGAVWGKSAGTLPSFHALGYGNGTFVASGPGEFYEVISLSADGIAWSDTITDVTDQINGITFGGGLFVAVGERGVILTSSDGRNWIGRSSGTADRLTDVAYANGIFVAVGRGVILVSQDGENWTKAFIPGNNSPFPSLYSITYGNGSFVAVGASLAASSSPLILTSTDGMNWVKPNSLAVDTLGFLTSVAHGNGTFLAVGYDTGSHAYGGIVLSARDVQDWTGKSNGSDPLLGVAFGSDTFVAAGEETLLTSSDGTNWEFRRISRSFNIRANEDSTAHAWLDTGIDTASGTMLTISASGTACIAPNYCQDPDGAGSLPDYNGCRLGSLVGRIGTGSQFCIGSNYQQVLQESGRLSLAYNDTDFWNNAGNFSVNLSVGPQTVVNLALKPVHRFYNSARGYHFYTISEEEKNNLTQNLPQFSYEGIAYFAYPTQVGGTVPVYRFYNTVLGYHFYTAMEPEKDSVLNNYPDYRFDGASYYAHRLRLPDTLPVYRFYNTDVGYHFFTISEEEKDLVSRFYPQYRLEGEAFYASPSQYSQE